MDLDAVYVNPSAPGCFSGVRILKRYGKRSERETKKFLAGRDAYTLHKPTRIRFPRRKTYTRTWVYKRTCSLLFSLFIIETWGGKFTAAMLVVTCTKTTTLARLAEKCLFSEVVDISEDMDWEAF